jgi:ribosomal protein L21E
MVGLWGTWYAGQSGGPIGKASSKPTLKIASKYKGDKLMVIVTVSVPGYSPGTAYSGLTGTVK